MSLSKKAKWSIIIVLFIIFVSFSVYRYQQVNRPFKNYSVVEKVEQSGKHFTVRDLSYKLGKPTLKENKNEIFYEIPLSIDNKTSEMQKLGVENFHIRSNFTNNMLDRERFLSNPINKDFPWEGVAANSSEQLVLIFSMQKEWGINPNTKADFFFLNI